MIIMVKILFQGEEIDLDNEIEPGEKELDLLQRDVFEDTIDLTKTIEQIRNEGNDVNENNS